MLDVNMGVPLADEAELLDRAVRLVQELTDLPLCIDSSVVEALEAGLAAYQGKALVNSVTGEHERMDAILPIVKRYGAAVIALPNEEDEIPDEPASAWRSPRRSSTSRRPSTASRSRTSSSTRWRCRSVPTPRYVHTTLETIELIRDEFGLNMTLGASNVSFGMPDRHALGRGVPADGDAGRADQRDHGRPHAADRRRGQGRGPAARPRRVGRGVDRGPPGQAGSDGASTP